MDNKRIHKIASDSSQNHEWLKQGWHNDAKSWINHWGIKEEVIPQNTNDITNMVKAMFKEDIWCEEEN